MGMNYYVKLDECKHCGRFEEIHLGKASCGWKFLFQLNGKKYYSSIDELKEWLKGKEIINEDDELVSHEEFWGVVAKKQLELLSHQYYDTGYEVIDGYEFWDCEFS